MLTVAHWLRSTIANIFGRPLRIGKSGCTVSTSLGKPSSAQARAAILTMNPPMQSSAYLSLCLSPDNLMEVVRQR